MRKIGMFCSAPENIDKMYSNGAIETEGKRFARHPLSTYYNDVANTLEESKERITI